MPYVNIKITNETVTKEQIYGNIVRECSMIFVFIKTRKDYCS